MICRWFAFPQYWLQQERPDTVVLCAVLPRICAYYSSFRRWRLDTVVPYVFLYCLLTGRRLDAVVPYVLANLLAALLVEHEYGRQYRKVRGTTYVAACR